MDIDIIAQHLAECGMIGSIIDTRARTVELICNQKVRFKVSIEDALELGRRGIISEHTINTITTMSSEPSRPACHHVSRPSDNRPRA